MRPLATLCSLTLLAVLSGCPLLTDPAVFDPPDFGGDDDDDDDDEGSCAPAAPLRCGDIVVGDTSDFNTGTTDELDHYAAATGYWSGPEIAYSFEAEGVAEVTVRLVDPVPTELDHDLFILDAQLGCTGAAAFEVGFNEVSFEVAVGATYYVVVDGYDGAAGPFVLDLLCDGIDGPDPVDDDDGDDDDDDDPVDDDDGSPFYVTDGLTALIAFEEGTGAWSTDLTGNGNDAELIGADWAGSGSASVSGGSDRIVLPSDPSIEESSFTYDMWFEAGSTAGNGRILGQARQVAGRGPDVLERSQRVAMRINNPGAVFDVPTIGTRSNDGPPDHWGTCADNFHRGDGPEHLVITHDAAAKTVRIFIGLEGEPLRLSFESTYQGSYDVDDDGLALLNLPNGDRPFAGRVFQFAYYDRVLTYAADGGRWVTGGEVLDNHLAGSAW